MHDWTKKLMERPHQNGMHLHGPGYWIEATPDYVACARTMGWRLRLHSHAVRHGSKHFAEILPDPACPTSAKAAVQYAYGARALQRLQALGYLASWVLLDAGEDYRPFYHQLQWSQELVLYTPFQSRRSLWCGQDVLRNVRYSEGRVVDGDFLPESDIGFQTITVPPLRTQHERLCVLDRFPPDLLCLIGERAW